MTGTEVINAIYYQHDDFYYTDQPNELEISERNLESALIERGALAESGPDTVRDLIADLESEARHWGFIEGYKFALKMMSVGTEAKHNDTDH